MEVNQQKLTELAKQKDIKFIILFGSQSIGSATDQSDFDVAVLLGKNKGFFDDFGEYLAILDGMSEILNIGESRIDLTDLSKANILLRYEVTTNGRLLYGDADEFANYQAFAFRDYHDAGPLFELEDVLIKKRQELIKQAITK